MSQIGIPFIEKSVKCGIIKEKETFLYRPVTVQPRNG